MVSPRCMWKSDRDGCSGHPPHKPCACRIPAREALEKVAGGRWRERPTLKEKDPPPGADPPLFTFPCAGRYYGARWHPSVIPREERPRDLAARERGTSSLA